MTNQLDIGRVISNVFDLYAKYAGVLLPLAAAVFIVDAAFQALGLVSTGLALLAGLVSIVLTTLFTGMVVSLVDDVRDGRLDQSPGELARSVTPVLLPLFAVSLLAGIGIGIGFVLLIIPGLILLTIWSVVSPVVVLERPGVFAAFGRSRQLVKGNGWQVFGVIVLFFLIFIAIGVVFGIIGAILGDVGNVIFNYIGTVLTAPLVALAAAVLYFELKGPTAAPAAPERPEASPPVAPA